jgi:sugar lactone lactonase YvrE
MRATVLCTTLAVAAACQPVDRKRPVSSAADTTRPVDTMPAVPPPPAAPGATRVLAVAGFSTPESVLHDSTQDIYFVSNINGSPTAKDNNGFISRVRPDGAIENLKFIEGGRAGVTLNAPKGLGVTGDTLWVADIDAVRAFNARTGAPVDSFKLDSAGAVFLNDLAIASGAIYITDTGIKFDDVGNVLHPGPDRVFRIGPDRKITIAARGDSLGWPNGIAVDPVGKRFVIVSFGPTKAVLAWKPGDKAPKVIAKGAGGFDGVVVVGTRILVSSWTDSTVSAYETGQEVKVITGVPSPADIGYDAKRNRVLVPIFTGNRVEIWQLQ